MVKVGFICEGFTEFYLLQSLMFKNILTELNISLVNVINAKGCGNLLPRNISGYISALESSGAEKIVILTDLDDDVCITQTKARITPRVNDTVIIAAKQIESWFLACNEAMKKLLNYEEFSFEYPENENAPFDTINRLLVASTGQGIGKNNGGKIKLINRLIANGLDLKEATSHPNCPSVNYLFNKLKELGTVT